jgi:peptidoglycan hydrolase CwlO-like protein
MLIRTTRLVGAIGVVSLLLIAGLRTTHAQQATSANVDAYRANLQSQLDALNAQIAQQQAILAQTQTQKASLQRDIAVLDAQIKSAKLAIQARDITIQQLTSDIAQKQAKINGLNFQLDSEKDSLASILRQKNSLENKSLIVALLSAGSLSQFFSDVDSFTTINKSLQQSFVVISSTTVATQAEKDALEDKLTEESQLRQIQQLQEKQVEAQQAQKNKLLADTKGQEANYQKLIAENQKSAAQIRNALFQLTGSAAIPFGNALDFANLAAQQTGIRPAFLLAIITEESNLGENVGTGTYTIDMQPIRDVPAFLAITSSLGLNPASMPVSKKAWYGWGGAMGPAQFIPTTWALYEGYVKPDYHYDSSKDRIGARTGNQPPNPWDPKDAFMASALYLTDSGADAKTPAAEFKAAMCYLAGCGNVSNKSLQFYGNAVLCFELKYQQDIDTIAGTHDADAMRANTLYYGQC